MSNRLPIFFIMMTVVIDAMGIGLIMPVMPDLIQEVLPGATLADAAVWGGILATVFAVMQFVFGPMVGNLSDRFGRKPVLLVALVVMAADYLLMAVAGTVWLLLIGRIVGGITAATHSTASAFMADISKPEEKAANFGLIGAGFGIGFVLGPVLGGLLAEFGTRAPFYAAAGLAFANALFGWFVLTETVTDKTRRAFSWMRANPFGAFKSIGSFPGLSNLMWVFFFYAVASVVYPATWSYFTAEKFGWSPGMIGVSLAIYGLSFGLVQGLLVAPAIKAFGERKTVVIGLVIEIVTFIFIGIAPAGWMVLVTAPIASLGAIGMPALQGIMSRNTPDDSQGELQGVLTSINAVGMILAPLVMTRAFAAFSGPDAPVYLPGAPYLLAAGLVAVATVIFVSRYIGRAPSDAA